MTKKGRPPVEEKRDKQVTLRLTEKEYKALSEFSEKVYLPVAVACRKIIKEALRARQEQG